MKYAKFSDDFLSYFRLDDNGETLVLTDKRGYTRAVKLLPYEERPHGKWKKYGDKVQAYDISGIKTWAQKRECTNCGFLKIYIEDFGFYSFCPNCGAQMKGGAE